MFRYPTLKLTLAEMKRSFIEVKYHQLLSRPIDELKRVFDYAGIDMGPYDIDAGALVVNRRA